MSVEAVKWALGVKTGKKGQIRKLALVKLAESHNGKTGECCFLTHKDIGDAIDQDERSVRRHVVGLEADGFITRKHRYDERGHRTTDHYVLHFEVFEPRLPDTVMSASLPDTVMSGSEAGLPDKSESLPDKKAPPTGHTLSGRDVPVTGRLEPEEERAPSAPSAKSARRFNRR